ncbi:hypothetical protein POSPLADRAFT_1185100 [Postia placenta MAD-698-R-SB12]|uniref:DNA-directed RNA polymerase III subunit RPC6 n=1 Tax=Postia placenta MAD-698-R-SB12 TaxID=670580 RepID=A0A1X6MQ50_9APHY|nr:hypothetical protein POSPLADRAFT_1185100 [Postia placenta MAD-698-R-SB12]OSX58243.1 hypothetical protein POSPLADRAFT_1185100 [Postia placenta MAD-698-R-SB12]
MSGRKPNALEQKLHQAALADAKKTLTQKECEALIPDASARMAAINFLLGTGLLKAMKDTKGVVSFRAVLKKELDVKKDMSGEENMVLSHIQASGNEGIWTKHLKAKTELHQTVIDRCLKSLVQKQLIKAVKSVKYPTRKIYMLFHLDPSVEMTGGPWYTDNELDTEFIKLLCSACLRFIREKSLPKSKSTSEDSSSRTQPLYPISAAPPYPTAQQILAFLSKSRITETQLNVEHVEMLLNVLVLDGEIEKVPAFAASLWDSSMNAGDDRDGSDSEDESEAERKRRKRKGKEKDSGSRSLKRKRSKKSRSDSESDSDSEEEAERYKAKKRRRKAQDSDSDEDMDRDRKRKRKKRRHDDESDESGSDDSDSGKNERKKSKSKSKSRNRKRKHDSSESESESLSETASSGSEDGSSWRSKSKSKSKSKSSSKSSRAKRSSSPAMDASGGIDISDSFGGAYVYRAIKQERVALGLSQAPCTRCPTFDFCKSGGPVDSQECVYYGDWLAMANVARE